MNVHFGTDWDLGKALGTPVRLCNLQLDENRRSPLISSSRQRFRAMVVAVRE